jgi:hypothetical protein
MPLSLMKVLILVAALLLVLMVQREPFWVHRPRKTLLPSHESNVINWNSMM